MCNKKTILVFSGYNNRAIITFLRTLEKNDISNYKIVAMGEKDYIFRTIYKSKVWYVRQSQELTIDVLKLIIDKLRTEKNESFWIVPSSEFLNRFMLEKREELCSIGCEIPLVSKELYEKISDKSSFKKLCMEQGLSVPQNIPVSREFFEAFVAKPFTYFSKDGRNYSPVLIKNENDCKRFNDNYDKSLFYYEQYIEGESYYLLYYFSQNKGVYSYSQKNLVQQPEGKSIVMAVSSDLHKCDIGKRYEKMFMELGFYGLVMIELRKCKDTYYMIEANPRLWGPSQLFYDSECNFFEVMLLDNGFIDTDVIFREKDSMYFWNGGVQQTKNKGKELVYLGVEEKEICKFNDELINCEIYNRFDTKELYLERK